MLGFRASLLSSVASGFPPLPIALTLTNGDFELGTTANWAAWFVGTFGLAVGGGFASGPQAGANCARIGASASNAAKNDTGVIPTAYQTMVDAGLCEYELTGYISGFSTDNDNGNFGVEFVDGGGVVIGTCWQPLTYDKNTNDWTPQYTVTAWVPPLTRTCRVSLRGLRQSGTNLDCYFDTLAHRLTPKPGSAQHAMILYDAGTALTGWTNITGALVVSTGPYGMTALRWGATATGESYKEANITAGAMTTSVDAGTATLQCNIGMSSNGSTSTHRYYIEFYDGSNVIIGTRQYAFTPEVVTAQIGVTRQFEVAIPTLTRKVRLGLVGTRVAGSGSIGVSWMFMSLAVEYT